MENLWIFPAFSLSFISSVWQVRFVSATTERIGNKLAPMAGIVSSARLMANDLTLSGLQELVVRLHSDLDDLEGKKKELISKIQEYNELIGRLERQITRSSAGNGARRPRGENLRQIKAIFKDEPMEWFTVQEIASKTGLKTSSVSVVLERLKEKNTIYKEDGQWTLVVGDEPQAEAEDE